MQLNRTVYFDETSVKTSDLPAEFCEKCQHPGQPEHFYILAVA